MDWYTKNYPPNMWRLWQDVVNLQHQAHWGRIANWLKTPVNLNQYKDTRNKNVT